LPKSPSGIGYNWLAGWIDGWLDGWQALLGVL